MYSVPEDLRLSKNFTLSEFACNDGSKEITIDYGLVDLLQQLRDILGKPVKVTSGYRTVTYNKKCGGISNKSSPDLGKAADLKVSGVTPLEVAKAADKMGFMGIGVYPTFTHVDVCGSVTGKKIYWKQNSKGVKSYITKL